jgi:hypothetical protein
VPSVSRVTFKPLTEHTSVVFDVRLTVKPELEVTVGEKGEAPKVLLVIDGKVMVWLTAVTVKVWLALAAASYVAFPA